MLEEGASSKDIQKAIDLLTGKRKQPINMGLLGAMRALTDAEEHQSQTRENNRVKNVIASNAKIIGYGEGGTVRIQTPSGIFDVRGNGANRTMTRVDDPRFPPTDLY